MRERDTHFYSSLSLSLSLYIYIYIYHVCMYIYIYIYIHMHSERPRGITDAQLARSRKSCAELRGSSNTGFLDCTLT